MITERDATKFYDKFTITPTGCWLWGDALDPDGYGRIRTAERSSALAHRFSYELLVGPIPDGFELDHLCRVRHCVNPDHLEAVTHLENVRRGFSPSARHAQKERCPEGHQYTQRASGRICKPCQVRNSREYRKRREAGR